MTSTKVICKLTPELDAKRTKRTGLKIEHFQPRQATPYRGSARPPASHRLSRHRHLSPPAA